MQVPKLRLNAFRLGVRLLATAINPWSGLTRKYAENAQWQPLHPYGLPRWWPFRPGSGRSVSLDELGLMRSVLPKESAAVFVIGAGHLRPRRPDHAAGKIDP